MKCVQFTIIYSKWSFFNKKGYHSRWDRMGPVVEPNKETNIRKLGMSTSRKKQNSFSHPLNQSKYRGGIKRNVSHEKQQRVVISMSPYQGFERV